MKTTAPVTPPVARKTQGLVQDPSPAPPPIEFDQIQGNIFGGFMKDFGKTRGGAYFLSPSIDTLRLLLKASDQP